MSIIKIFEFTPYVIGYHVYKDRRTPVKSEMLKEIVESKNREDKFAVAIMKDDCLAAYLAKVRTGKFAKNIFCFLRACDTNTCSQENTGKAINQGDGIGMKVPSKSYFSTAGSFIKILRQRLPKTL